MIQFNLLPDVKLEYIRARRTRRLVTLVSVVVSAAALGVLLLSLVVVDVVQKRSLSDLDHDITAYSAKLKAVPNLGKILTVQNQLNTLTGLHDQKPVTSRVFAAIAQLTPTNVTISNLQLDFSANTMQITGTASGLDAVNRFVDTLKSTSYVMSPAAGTGQAQQQADAASKPAFSSVVLSQFGKSSNGATYNITMNFDPLLFSNTNNVSLHVPNGTVSNTSILFQKTAGQ